MRMLAQNARVRPKPTWCPTRGPAVKELCFRRIHEQDGLADMHVQFNDAFANDFAQYAVSRADELEIASFNNDSAKVASILRSYKKQSQVMQTRLADEDGINVQSSTAEKQVVRRHFARALNGTETSLAAILDTERREAVENAAKYRSVIRQLESIPALQFVTTKNASSKPNKGNGESCLAADVDKCCPSALAQASHPLQVKSAIYLDRPLQWRGDS